VRRQWCRYNEIMRIERLHEWNVTIDQAIKIQHDLANKVIQRGKISSPRLIAGLDVSVRNTNEATAVAVVLNYPELEIIEKAIEKGTVEFPYIPGLLSFREVPITLKACNKLKTNPDLVMVDGQGIAHPRMIGLASHLGLFLNIPTIGCAKSPLYGNYEEPPNTPGSYTDITDNEGMLIGGVLRTKLGVRPLYISVGHMIELSSAIQWVLQCCQGYRLPEPTRRAHLASKGNL
jgi:deoxyribonuclease V